MAEGLLIAKGKQHHELLPAPREPVRRRPFLRSLDPQRLVDHVAADGVNWRNSLMGGDGTLLRIDRLPFALFDLQY